MANILHTIGSYPLLIGLFSQFVVLYGAGKAHEKPAIIQATMLILALGFASTALMMRPHSPPQLIPDLLGCVAALLLFAPAVESVRKLLAKQPEPKQD